ncbi:hypothetical protein P153DRAFT_83728 [Dothidotthia symphoricarpi CBS 119687]|uniref:Uncharacterized protein n=1 Tax=Dothidotthia symphoricarpi CBS 119687 TaxID=1392245 RepID=A0A6A6A4E7_9PLEO|nr:uncharacterized protein P153DRAFT_83728 [Dothidotthia symphoricarpi CBS 119687]KAF2126023.1 hypothetical protein P153DRAFT_83728 [Dothidotthia symphoricarpi CBS 119687]
MEGYPARGMRRGMGYGGRRGGMGVREMDMRSRSAPEMYMGPQPGMGMMGSPRMGGRGMAGMGMGMGMPSPRMGGRGMNGMGMGMPSPRMNPMGMAGMGGRGMPPEYTPMPAMPHYGGGGGGGGGGMPNAAENPYAYPPAPSESTSSPSVAPLQPQPRRPGRPPGLYERVPMAAYTAPSKPTRSYTEPPTSTKLNRNQPASKKVGPSGREWLDGDAFLDACVCTTNCTCRKGHRVLYRSKDDAWDEDAEGENRYGSGEIRYILKEDLGRDCGDHEGCKEKKSTKSSDDESARKERKKGKKQVKKEKEKFEGFKEELLEALDERFEDMKKSQKPQRGTRFAADLGNFEPPGPSPFGMEEPGMHMDPRMAQRRGMPADPYGMNMGGMSGMGKMAPGMADPMMGRNMPGTGNFPPGMNAMSAMGGMNRMPPGMNPRMPMSMPPHAMTNGMAFEDSLSISDMGMDNPYAMGPGGMNRKGRNGAAPPSSSCSSHAKSKLRNPSKKAKGKDSGQTAARQACAETDTDDDNDAY